MIAAEVNAGTNTNWPLRHIRLDADDMIREVEANGFRLVSRSEHVPASQYIAVFVKAQR